MDNVITVRDVEKHFSNVRAQLLYVEDPKFFQFPNEIKLYKGDTLVIEGENLNMASDETDVIVTIGPRACNVTSLAMTQLVCSPPEQQPPNTDENEMQVCFYCFLMFAVIVFSLFHFRMMLIYL